MTLQPRCEDVETAEGVAITVTGVAQVITTLPDRVFTWLSNSRSLILKLLRGLHKDRPLVRRLATYMYLFLMPVRLNRLTCKIENNCVAMHKKKLSSNVFKI